MMMVTNLWEGRWYNRELKYKKCYLEGKGMIMPKSSLNLTVGAEAMVLISFGTVVSDVLDSSPR